MLLTIESPRSMPLLKAAPRLFLIFFVSSCLVSVFFLGSQGDEAMMIDGWDSMIVKFGFALNMLMRN